MGGLCHCGQPDPPGPIHASHVAAAVSPQTLHGYPGSFFPSEKHPIPCLPECVAYGTRGIIIPPIFILTTIFYLFSVFQIWNNLKEKHAAMPPQCYRIQ